jgi:hypothetical protein
MTKIKDLDRKSGKPENPEFHYTPESLVKFLMSEENFPIVKGKNEENLPIVKGISFLDPASGTNMVFYNNVSDKVVSFKDWDEIELQRDFFEDHRKFDWIATNPPYHQIIDFLFHSAEVAQIGFSFLLNIEGINALTPRRLERLYKEYGFGIKKILVVSVKKWFGRYYWVTFTKEKPFAVEYNTVNWE